MTAPQFVTPYVKTNKNGALDAEAICEAATRIGLQGVDRDVPLVSLGYRAVRGCGEQGI
jgi:transposase